MGQTCLRLPVCCIPDAHKNCQPIRQVPLQKLLEPYLYRYASLFQALYTRHCLPLTFDLQLSTL